MKTGYGNLQSRVYYLQTVTGIMRKITQVFEVNMLK